MSSGSGARELCAVSGVGGSLAPGAGVEGEPGHEPGEGGEGQGARHLPLLQPQLTLPPRRNAAIMWLITFIRLPIDVKKLFVLSHLFQLGINFDLAWNLYRGDPGLPE